MLQTLLHVTLISFFCLVWGFLITIFFRRREPNIIIFLPELIMLFFSGLCLLSIVSSWLCILGPVKYWQLVVLSVPAIVFELYWLINGKLKFDFNALRVRLHVSEIIFVLAVLLLFQFLGAGRPQMEDTDLYHLQTIKWTSEYGPVPGIANLYLRYGFYSNWFHLISLFNFPFHQQNFLYLNNTLCVWTFFFIFYKYKKHAVSNENQAVHFSILYFLLLIYMLFEWRLFRSTASSTSYDFVVTALTIIIISLIAEKIFDRKNDPGPTFILFLASAPFFKITGVLPLTFLLLYFWLWENKKKQIFHFILIFLIAAIPYLYKNFIQTGYPLFPFTIGKIFNPDWQVPISLLDHFNKFIYLTNHYINWSFPASAWHNNDNFSYINDWFFHLTKPDKFITCLSFFGALIGWALFKKAYPAHFKKLIAVQMACYIPLIICLLSAPDTRFFFGLLLMSSLLPLSMLLAMFWHRHFFYAGFFFIAFFSIKYVGDTWNSKFKTTYLLQPPKTLIPRYKTVTINNFNYNIPEFSNNLWNRRCFGTPLPCIYQSNNFLIPRGSKIEDGFKMDGMLDSTFLLKYKY